MMLVPADHKPTIAPGEPEPFEINLPHKKAGTSATQSIQRKTDRSAPLSFAQERIWFLEQLEPNGAAHHVSLALCLEGALEPDLVQRCLNEIVRRHEILRTRFKGWLTIRCKWYNRLVQWRSRSAVGAA